MNEQFQTLKELFHESPPRPSTHRDIETSMLKILSNNQIPVYIHLLKVLQMYKVDIITRHFPCFQDFWHKLKPWLSSRKPKSFRDQCFKVLISLFALHRPPTSSSESSAMTHETLFEDIFSTISDISDAGFEISKLKFYRQLYDKRKIFNYVALVESILEIVVSATPKNPTPTIVQEGLEFLTLLFQREKMTTEENFTSIIKSYSHHIVQYRMEELFTSLFVFLKKPEIRIPHRGYIHLCTMLCQSVNFNETFCSKSTEIMKFLISKNPYIFSILIDLLNSSPFVAFYRGAVFFIGVFSWGRFAMKELTEYRIMTLKAMYKVLSVNDQPLNFEIILSIKRLILNFGSTIIIEWDILFKILRKMKKIIMLPYPSKSSESDHRYISMTTRLKKEVKSCVQVVFDLFKNGRFLGEENKLLKLMLFYRPEFSENVKFSKFLIDHIPCCPKQSEQWETHLKLLMLEFFKNEENVLVKLLVLDIIKDILVKYSGLYGTEILKIVMPYLKDEKRDYVLYFLIWMADRLELSSKKFILICSTLNHMLINETIYESHPTVFMGSLATVPPFPKNTSFFPKQALSPTPSLKKEETFPPKSKNDSSPPNQKKEKNMKERFVSGNGKDWNHKMSSRRGREIREGTKLKLMHGMVQIFLLNFDRSPVIKSKIMFNFILKFLPHLPDRLLREMLTVFLRFGATSLAQLKIGTKISPYLYVHHSSSSAPGVSTRDQNLDMQSRGFVPSRRLSCEVDLSKLMEILWNLILVKDSPEVLLLILKILMNCLRNFYILKDFSVEKLIYIVTSFVQKKLIMTGMDETLPHLPVDGNFIPNNSDINSSDTHSRSRRRKEKRRKSGDGDLEESPRVDVERLSPRMMILVTPLLHLLRLLVGFVANKPSISRSAKSEFVKLVLSLSTQEVQTKLCFDQRIEFQEQYLNVLYFLVSELADDVVEHFYAIQKYLSSLKPIYSVVILKLRMLHSLNHMFPQLMKQPQSFYNSLMHPKRRVSLDMSLGSRNEIIVVERVVEMIVPYISKRKFSYFIRSLAYTSLMSWFVRCNFSGRKRLLRKCFPTLYLEMAKEKSRLAESFLDFLIKYTYINCEQKFDLNPTLKSQFTDMDYRAWALGNGILTAQVGKFGYVLLRHRRPTGNIGWTMKLVNTVLCYRTEFGMMMEEEEDDPHHMILKNRFTPGEEKNLRYDLSYLLQKNRMGHGGDVINHHHSRMIRNEYNYGKMMDGRGLDGLDGSESSLSTVGGRSLSMPSEEDLSFSEELLDSFGNRKKRDRHRINNSLLYHPISPLSSPSLHQHNKKMKKKSYDHTSLTDKYDGSDGTDDHSLDSMDATEEDTERNLFPTTTEEEGEEDLAKNESSLLDEEEEDGEEEEEEEDRFIDHSTFDPVAGEELLLEREFRNHQKRRSLEEREEQFEEEDFFVPMEEKIKEITSFDEDPKHSYKGRKKNQNQKRRKKKSNGKKNEKNGSDKVVDINRMEPLESTVEKNNGVTMTKKKNIKKRRKKSNGDGSALKHIIREAAMNSPPQRNKIKQMIPSKNKKKNKKNKNNLKSMSLPSPKTDGSSSSNVSSLMGQRNGKASGGPSQISLMMKKQQEKEREEQKKMSQMQEMQKKRLTSDRSVHEMTGLMKNKMHMRKKEELGVGMMSSSESSTSLETKNSIIQKSVLHPNFPYLFLRHWSFLSQEPPQGLKVCQELSTALNAFDFTPCHEIFRIGVVFVDRDQKTENEIFLNTYGTPRYLDFLKTIGEVVFLKKVDEMYAAGLDVSKEEKDGKFTIIHKDQISHTVFHVATFMPNLENKPTETRNRKKRLIGNDYVVIVYNLGDHEEEFNLNLISSQALYILIIVHPLEKGYNMIKIKIRKEKLRGILSFLPVETIVSDVSLPRVIRNYCRISCLAINAFNKKQQSYESVWSERINMTKRIKAQFTRKIPKKPNQGDSDVKLQKEINDFFLDS